METRTLSDILKRAASLLAASGAKSQARATEAVADVVASRPDDTVDAFVAAAAAALEASRIEELSAQAIVDRIHEGRRDKSATASILEALKARPVTRDKLIEVAMLLTGARKLAIKSRPQALKIIQQFLDERAYLDSKEAMNAKVTPW
jgi:hypothetical protein